MLDKSGSHFSADAELKRLIRLQQAVSRADSKLLSDATDLVKELQSALSLANGTTGEVIVPIDVILVL